MASSLAYCYWSHVFLAGRRLLEAVRKRAPWGDGLGGGVVKVRTRLFASGAEVESDGSSEDDEEEVLEDEILNIEERQQESFYPLAMAACV